MSTLAPLASLLLSTAFLLVGHGMQLTLLPLRAATLGHTDLQIALGGSAYFGGFIAGCLIAPRVIARAGHIRSFAVLASAMVSVLLLLGLSGHWLLWSLLRFSIGLFVCGLYTVIESWLNDQAMPENRGRILSLYTFLVLASMAGGQLLINVAPIASATPFMLLAAVIALSVIPVGMTRRLAPAPIESTTSRIRVVFSRSPPAAIGAILAGAVTGSFWSLGAVFANRSLGSLEQATLFMTIGIVGGALLQYPFGWLSDRIGRSRVLFLLGALAAAASASVAMAPDARALFAAIFLFGACSMPIYAMSLASAADNSLRHEFVEIGTSILLLNASGAALAPLAIGQIMALFGQPMLFWSCAALCAGGTVLIGLFSLRAPRVDDVVPFSAAAADRAPTSFDLDPRAPEEATGDLSPAEELPSLDDATIQAADDAAVAAGQNETGETADTGEEASPDADGHGSGSGER